MRNFENDPGYDLRLEKEIMRLAMIAIDIRSKVMPQDAARIPSLSRALEAWDDVVAELGWSEPRKTARTPRVPPAHVIETQQAAEGG